jgi:hypothetical protein
MKRLAHAFVSRRFAKSAGTGVSPVLSHTNGREPPVRCAASRAPFQDSETRHYPYHQFCRYLLSCLDSGSAVDDLLAFALFLPAPEQAQGRSGETELCPKLVFDIATVVIIKPRRVVDE